MPEFNIIHFAGYTEIAEEDSVLLYENLQIIQDNPDIDVELDGYTDTVGPDSFNLVKSQARADNSELSGIVAGTIAPPVPAAC